MMKADFKMASDKESLIEKKQIFVDHCEQTYEVCSKSSWIF
jgi:hypothetical protein